MKPKPRCLAKFPRQQQGGTFGRSSFTSCSVGTNKISSHITLYWVKLPSHRANLSLKSFSNPLRGSQLLLSCREDVACPCPMRGSSLLQEAKVVFLGHPLSPGLGATSEEHVQNQREQFPKLSWLLESALSESPEFLLGTSRSGFGVPSAT